MTTKTVEELLGEYNIIREATGKKPLKTWKQGLLKLVELVAKQGVRVTKGAPAIASGAYATERQARYRTGVKGAGVNGHKIKTVAPAKTTPDSASRNVASGEIHLSEIAASIDMTPRTARIKARAHKANIRKLEVAGKKYVFPEKAKSLVIDILRTRHQGE